MSLLSFICGLNAVLFLYLAWTFTCQRRTCDQKNLRIIFAVISAGSILLALGELLFELNLIAMDDDIPVALATFVDERALLPEKVALTVGGILLLLGLKKFYPRQ
jgi:hypothetical protein